jgi:hypothetical protein
VVHARPSTTPDRYGPPVEECAGPLTAKIDALLSLLANAA